MENTPLTRPRSISLAVWLLAGAGLIDMMAVLLRGGVLVVPCIGLAAIAVLSVAALKGYAWSRSVLLVWCALKFMSLLPEIYFALTERHILLLAIASTALFVVACECLFRRPAFLWFNEMGMQRYRDRLHV